MIAELSLDVILVLLVSGVLVGFINTLAGGATIISITTFMVLGLPITQANGTNRIPAFFENLAASVNFFRKKHLDIKLGLKLAIPAIAGNIVGSQIAVTVSEEIVKTCLGVVLVVVLIFVGFSTEKRLKRHKGAPRVRVMDYFWFFLIGVYGGYIYVGLGYMILAVALMSMRMNLVTANAIKGFVIMVSLPFSMVIFMLNGDVDYKFGTVHAVGNIIGAFLATQYAIGWGMKFLRWFFIAVVLVCLADVLQIIDLRTIISSLL